jgi:GNAT superfamily N-acetyltransferase
MLKDVAAIAGLQNAAAGALTHRFGEGHWSTMVTERGVELSLRRGRGRVGIADKKIVSVLHLATKKPWSIDISCFTPVERPLYLTGMTIAVQQQGKGVGRLALDDALTVARGWPADSIRLDAYDTEAGAGSFYGKCGFTERGRVVYRGNPLVYYERLLN